MCSATGWNGDGPMSSPCRRSEFPRRSSRRRRSPAWAIARNRFAGKSWYGVALLARKDLPAPQIVERGLPGGDGRDDGLLTARIGDVVVSSVYAPYGNPAVRGKDGALSYKVAWLDRLIAHLEERRIESDRSLLCGDFNVLPDVPAKRGVPNCTPEEQQRLRAICGTGFVDLYRRVNPLPDAGLNYGFNPRLPPTWAIRCSGRCGGLDGGTVVLGRGQ